MANQIALVTGSNQGIGLAVVELLLDQGMQVILTSRYIEKGRLAAAQLANSGRLHVHQLDVSDDTSVHRLAQHVQHQFGKLDVLVNNAGINYDTWQTVTSADIDKVRQTFETNVLGAWRTVLAFLPLLQRSRQGRIINVSSGGGSLHAQNGATPAYSLSKLAMNGLTMQLSNALKHEGIAVNCVCPGWVRTQMGGAGADRSPQKGAETIVWAATQPDQSMTGVFLRDKRVIDW